MDSTRREPRTSRDRLVVLLVVSALVEAVWTVYLGWRLPRHYVAHHWFLAWVGLDVGEIATLLATAWAAWRRRAVLIGYAIAAATLLVMDAWFDVTTAGRGSVGESVILAFVVELPMALLMVWVAWRAARRLVVTYFADGPLAAIAIRDVPFTASRDD